MGGEAAYLASLSRCRPWEARGGKTRSYFAKTCDDRYIVKQLQPSEKRSFPEIAPSYFRYLAHAMRKSLPTCLAKIMGIYTVGLLAGPCLPSVHMRPSASRSLQSAMMGHPKLCSVWLADSCTASILQASTSQCSAPTCCCSDMLTARRMLGG